MHNLHTFLCCCQLLLELLLPCPKARRALVAAGLQLLPDIGHLVALLQKQHEQPTGNTTHSHMLCIIGIDPIRGGQAQWGWKCLPYVRGSSMQHGIQQSNRSYCCVPP